MSAELSLNLFSAYNFYIKKKFICLRDVEILKKEIKGHVFKVKEKLDFDHIESD